MIVDATSRIDVTAKGYAISRTTGNTAEGGAWSSRPDAYGAGGSYGGIGAVSDSADARTNAVYGDYADPDDWGSGGTGAAGGGLVRLTANTLQLDGQVLATGGFGGYGISFAGGSGGGIYVAVGTLTGNGLIKAAGGAAEYASAPGGGGRVAVYAEDSAGFDLAKITAPGGGGSAGAGTVYLRETGASFGTLIVDGTSGSTGWTPLGLPGNAWLVFPMP